MYHNDTLLFGSAHFLFQVFQIIFQECGIISAKWSLQPRELLIFIMSSEIQSAISLPFIPMYPGIHKNCTILLNSANLFNKKRIWRLRGNTFILKNLETIKYRANWESEILRNLSTGKFLIRLPKNTQLKKMKHNKE